MSAIFCFGDAMIQLFPRDPDARLEDTVYFKKHIGGAAAVSAYSAAALGGLAAFVGAIPAGGFGGYIRYTLKTAGVNLGTAVTAGNDSPVMLVKGLKNGSSATIFLSEPAAEPVGDLSALKVSKQDLVHLSPQCVYPEAVKGLGELLKAADRENCPLSISLDDWFADPKGIEAVYTWLGETLERFSVVFLSEQVLERLGKGAPERIIERISACAAAFFLFKKDGKILLYQGKEAAREAKSYAIPLVNSVNRQAVFAGAFLTRCMAAGTDPSGRARFLNHRADIEEAFNAASASAALGAGHRSGLLPFPALAEVERLVQGSGETAVQKEEREKLAEKAAGDYYRLAFHLMPQGGWMNDPNGLIQYKGKYHAFYQHYPYAPEWGPMHWGHAVSEDLLHWEYLPFALTPDQRYEKGCFSGSAVDNNGELSLVYTAHDDTRSPKEVQCVAFSLDGVHFTKYENNPVIAGPPPGFGEDFRDPKAFRHGDRWYLVAGCTRNRQGGIQLYASTDFRHWDYRGLACTSDGSQGDMWECPDLFNVDDTWTLICSPMNMKSAKTIYIIGEMDFPAASFTQKRWGNLDYGLEFYAPQTFGDDKGRRILLGWMAMWNNECPTQKNGWSGALTFPRELFIRDGELWQRPVEELKLLRKRELFQGDISLSNGHKGSLGGVRGDCMELEFNIPSGEKREGTLTLLLRCSEDRKEKTLLTYNFSSRIFTLEKRQASTGKPVAAQTPPVETSGEIPVHILVDRSSVEVFLYGGRYTITNRIYPKQSSIFYDIFAEGTDSAVSNVHIWELSAAPF